MGWMSEQTPPSDIHTHTHTHTPRAWAYPLSLAQRHNSLTHWEDKSTVGWTGKVTQSGRGTLRASLPRSAGRPSALAGVRRGMGGGGLPTDRVLGRHTP